MIPSKRTRPFAVRDFPIGCGKHETTETSSANDTHFQHPSKHAKLDLVPYSRNDSRSSATQQTVTNGSNVSLVSSSKRREVQELLKLYRQVLKKVEDEAKLKLGKSNNVHERAAMLLRHKWVNVEKRFGSVPGVEIGDRFQFRAELHIIGLHRQFQKGIDYLERDGILLATSIVVTDRYDNHMNSPDVLIYYGEGGNPKVRKYEMLKDQVLEHGNLALRNCIQARTPVRVIRTEVCKRSKLRQLLNPRKSLLAATSTYYFYDGLYLVEKFWQERGEFGKLVFKFQLRRISGQRRENRISGPLLNDISGGKERLPIAVVNTIDSEKPSPFTYIANISYNGLQVLSLSSGCDCTDGCSNSKECSCKTKSGLVFPYDDNKRLITRTPCAYECGPFCKCSDSCNYRVSQLGSRFQLEVFKTEAKGWGVRSRSFIRAGSFICEYVGTIHQAKEAEQWSGKDDYLFNIGNNQDVSFTIDAAQCGNVGRFINHSCSPNLVVQNVLYDHNDRRLPHVMLFAREDIPPYKELTYDYNSRLGALRYRTNGNVNPKVCMCKSPKCIGMFY